MKNVLFTGIIMMLFISIASAEQEYSSPLILDTTGQLCVSKDYVKFEQQQPVCISKDYINKIYIMDSEDGVVFEGLVSDIIESASKDKEIENLKKQLEQKDNIIQLAYSEIKKQAFSNIEKDSIISNWKMGAKQIIKNIEKDEKKDYVTFVQVLSQTLFQLMMQKEDNQ